MHAMHNNMIMLENQLSLFLFVLDLLLGSMEHAGVVMGLVIRDCQTGHPACPGPSMVKPGLFWAWLTRHG